VTRPAPTPDEDPTHEPNVRTHRIMYPNRRPLLISAILVALTSIPTIIVVAAGTATLHDREPSRPPAIAAPSGPVVVQPHSTAGLREEPPLASESGHGRAGSGGGGALSLGTGGSQPNAAPQPANAGSNGGKGPTGPNGSGGNGSSGTGGAQNGSGSGSTSGSSSGSTSGSNSGSSSGQNNPGNPEDCPTPSPSPTPAPAPTQGSGGRIDDDAWPGWDSGFHG
jgi:hypothetical protein